MEYHVAKNGYDTNPGTQSQPFLTISKAAKVAMPGDIVTVHAGTYREWVKPENGGTSNITRITYQAAKGEKVVIKGSEEIKGWKNVEGSVWKVILPNTMFGDYNPYSQPLEGDWFVYPKDYLIHTGDVYVNGKSFYEAASLDEVKNPAMKIEGFCPLWMQWKEYILNPERTVYVWYCKVEKDTTTIYANFHEYDPIRN